MRRMLVDIDFDEVRRRRAEARAALLERYGWPETVSCARCGDHGVPPDERSYCTCVIGEQLQITDARKKDWQQRIPRRCWEYSLESAPDQRAATVVRQWLNNRPISTAVNLVIAGEPGTGKTGLAVGALRVIHERGDGHSIGFLNVPDYLDSQRPSERPESRMIGEQLRHRAERCSLLVFDDLGADKASEWVSSQIYAVVNTRYDAGRPMIVTTNLTRRELAESYGDRVIDRIVERSVLISMDGPNLRRST